MDLYHPLILEYQDRKTHYGKRPEAQHHLQAYNPVCGDSFDIFFDVREERVSNVRFSGYGCAVSRASTAVLVEMMEGKHASEVRDLVNNYLSFIEQGKKGNIDDKWIPFQKAGQYPGRMQCATLSWAETRDFFIKTQ